MQSLKNKIGYSLATLLLIFSINARTEDTIFLDKGKPAPYSGILFTEEKAQSIRKELLESDKTSLKLESADSKVAGLGQIISLKDTEIELYRKQNQDLLKAEKTSESMRYIWFGLGVLATGMAVYGAGALAK